MIDPTTTPRESRQTRRWLAHQCSKNPAPTTRQPFALLCRSEDDQGHGAWMLIEVESPDEGDACARALRSILGKIPDEPLPRCELVPNSNEGLQAWAAANVKRRDAARRLGEVLL